MRFDRTLVAIFLLCSTCAFGCADEVGTCDDPQRGEDTVLVNGSVQFGGQAIMNLACASCHSSTAKGSARRGAPAGLDFDLFPIDPDNPELAEGPVTEKGQTYIKLSSVAKSGLLERQRRVFEDRNVIWQQVKDGMMPPPGSEFDGFRLLKGIIGTTDAAPCQADVGELAPLSRKSSRDVLRKWLACRAPVVEVNSSDKVVVSSSRLENAIVGDAGIVADAGILSAAVSGDIGYQFPVCEGSADGGTQITIERVYERVLGQCASCHSTGGQVPDLSSANAAYTSLVGATSAKCKKPYVTKGDAAKSFIYEIVADDPSCSIRMPQGGELTTSEIKLVSDWIAGGALRESDLEKSRGSEPLQSVGLDAGTPD